MEPSRHRPGVVPGSHCRALTAGVHGRGCAPELCPSPHRWGVCRLLRLRSICRAGRQASLPLPRPPPPQPDSPAIRPPVHPSIHPAHSLTPVASGQALPCPPTAAEHNTAAGWASSVLYWSRSLQLPAWTAHLGWGQGAWAGCPLLGSAVRGGGSPLAGPFLSSRLPLGPAGARGRPLAVGAAAAWWVLSLARWPGVGRRVGRHLHAFRARRTGMGANPPRSPTCLLSTGTLSWPQHCRPAYLYPWPSQPPTCAQLSHHRTAKTHK